VPPPEESKPVSQRVSNPVRTLLLLLPLTLLALAPVLSADFIRLDDHGHLFENPELRQMSVSGLAALWTKSYFNLYIPVTYSVWWALAMVGRLFGELSGNAWLFHAFNLAVHLGNVTLVFFVVRRLIPAGTRNTPPDGDALDSSIALISALFFALHPAQIESVAWVSELKGELAAMFGLLGLWWHYRSRQRLLVAGLFVAAMLSKPSAIVFPGVVFLIDRIVLRKRLGESALTPALYGVPLLILAAVTKHLQPDSDQDFIPTAAQRLLVAADAIAFYLCKVLVPFPLAVDYGRTPQVVLGQASRWWLVSSALLSVAGIAVVVKALVRPPSPGRGQQWQSLVYCGWAIFIVSIVPVVGLIPFAFQNFSTVANHYLYLPLLGVSVIVAGILVRFRAARISRRIAAVALVVCAALSFHQAWLWRSTEPLFAYTVKVNPRSYLGFFCVGDELMRSGRIDEAIDWLERSHAIKPDYLNTVLTLGMAFTQKGEPGKAIELYGEALTKQPSIVGKRAKNVASVHNNLGMLLLQSGQPEAGVGHVRKAVEIFPRSLNAHLNLGNIAFNQHRYADAVSEYQAALSLSPGSRGIEQRLELARQRARQP
jgi:Flp pilus assembly protein TadD